MPIHVPPWGFEAFAEKVGRPVESLIVPPREESNVAALTEGAARDDLDVLGPLPE